MRVAPDPLVENDQVEDGGQEPPEPDERVGDVDQGRDRGQEGDPAPMIPQASGRPGDLGDFGSLPGLTPHRRKGSSG
jgi:hypothetical protein